MIPVEKVVAYITRDKDGQKQLLVNLGQDALQVGVQVPVGIVNLDEPVLDALFREIKSVAGLEANQLRLEQKLAEYAAPVEGVGQAQKRHVFHLTVTEELPDRWEYGSEKVVSDYFWMTLKDEDELRVGFGDYLNRIC